MVVDLERLCDALRAEYERWEWADREDIVHVFRFHDSIMRYELHLNHPSDTVMLAVDPEKPVQACPLLEFTFPCVEIEIGENAYFETAGPALRFWGNDREPRDLRLTLTPRSDNRWYIWANAWDHPPEATR